MYIGVIEMNNIVVRKRLTGEPIWIDVRFKKIAHVNVFDGQPPRYELIVNNGQRPLEGSVNIPLKIADTKATSSDSLELKCITDGIMEYLTLFRGGNDLVRIQQALMGNS